jgi:selenocysteine lyase/cysteine desulfurase
MMAAYDRASILRTDLSARDEFAVPQDVVFLNAANIGPRLAAVRSAETAALDRWSAPWLLTADDWFADTERLRVLAAPLFNATPDDIAIIPSVSYAMAVAIQNVPIARGQSIVVLGEEFPSNYYAWEQRARESGAELRVVEKGADGSWTTPILAAIDARTAVVCVPVCHWTDGALIGIEAVAHRAHAVGAAFVIDASQSLGIIPFDVKALDPDFVVAVGYKWLLGPFGTSYLYVAPRHQEGRSIEQAWAMRRGSQDLSRLTEYQAEFRSGARRFDAGEHQNFILLPMAIAALEHAQRWEATRIDAWLSTLTHALAAIGASCGFQPTPKSVRSPHFLGLRVGSERAKTITAALRTDGIYVAARGASIRVAPHMHTTAEDVSRFAGALAKVR